VILKLLNYSIRSLMVLLGIYFMWAPNLPAHQDVTLIRVMGIVIFLFGIYRLSIYHLNQKRYDFEDEEND
jgi:hypothetical protein